VHGATCNALSSPGQKEERIRSKERSPSTCAHSKLPAERIQHLESPRRLGKVTSLANLVKKPTKFPLLQQQHVSRFKHDTQAGRRETNTNTGFFCL
jgi:hypothetical protein